MSDPYDEFIIGRRTSTLGEVRPVSGLTDCYLEVTFNHPRTVAFKNANSHKQKALYNAIWHVFSHAIGMDKIVRARHVFEFCKSGHVHLHGVLQLKVPVKHSPQGLVADFVKCFLNEMPRKYARYNDNCMYSQYVRYKSPAILVQYRSSHETERVSEWEVYMNKSQ